MMQQKLEELSEEQRKEIFRELVDAQDHDHSVKESRKIIGERYGLSDEDIRHIEREGLEGEWPPLS
jgi:DNA-directed RNA polymerase sigma subunit (sigma70/sigma32)